MAEGTWPAAPWYARPTVTPGGKRQVAVLNLPRDYDWVQLLVPSAQEEIAEIREHLAQKRIGLPTSTPDLAGVALPSDFQEDLICRRELANLKKENQTL